MNHYKVIITPLTAVHIGTGNEFGPMEYLIKKNEKGENEYIRFSTEKVVSDLSDDQKTEFFNIIESDDLMKIGNFLRKSVNNDNFLYKSQATPSLFNLYSKKIKDLNNQLLISEIYREKEKFRPVIPGSSLKGAIRTALLDEYVKDFNVKEINNRNLNEKAFGMHRYDAKRDPFRAVRISDCVISGKNSDRISSFVNFKENRFSGQDFSNMQIINEQIKGTLLGGDASGICDLTIDKDLQSIRKQVHKWEPLDKCISLKEIIKSCNKFYKGVFKEEQNKFYTNSKHSNLPPIAQQISKCIEEIDEEKGECLIRVGKYSQIESITVEKHRDPNHKKGFGKTRTLTEDYYPVGWVILKIVTSEQIKQYNKEKMEQERLAAEAEKQKQFLIDEAKRKKKDEEERIEAMSDEERLMLEIEGLSKDTQLITSAIRKSLDSEFDKKLYILLKEKLNELSEWKPYGSKQKKKKMAKIKEDIEKRIND